MIYVETEKAKKNIDLNDNSYQFFALLLKIDMRENPQNYQNNNKDDESKTKINGRHSNY